MMYLIYKLFFMWTLIKQIKYVEIKQFSKVESKQNYISTVILLNKFLVDQWDPRAICKEVALFTNLFT